MRTGKVKIVGNTRSGALRGVDVRVLVETPDGEDILVPALSLVLRVGSRHEMAIATIDVPAVMVDLSDVKVETIADLIAPGAPIPFDQALGKLDGERVADVELYAESHRVMATGIPLVSAPEVDVVERFERGDPDPDPDPMADLDAYIAGRGV